MLIRLLIIILVFLIACKVQKQEKTEVENQCGDNRKTEQLKPLFVSHKSDYFKNNFLRYEDFIYKRNIKTVLLHKEGLELSIPVIELNTGEKLKLSFDDLEGGHKTYKYRFIHCDAYWQPSDIMESEYLNGFYDDYITDYKYSYNTRQKYTHYELTFPSENMSITVSGNYVLAAFTDESRDSLIFTKRFLVYEPKLSINPTVKRATRLEDRNYRQEIDFTITANSYRISNPYNDLKVVITQNGRWDNTLNNLKPMFVRDNFLDYNFDEGNSFRGGNEYRRFDIKSLKYNSERIRIIQSDSLTGRLAVYLKDDERRNIKVYMSDIDINGRRFIKSEDNVKNSSIEADYVFVNFCLPYKPVRNDGDFYIMGALTDWNFNKEAKMKYNYDNQCYENVLYLKQGYYNYQYVFLENGAKQGDETVIEGSHYETENEYIIYVYHREAGTLFDKLVGVKMLTAKLF